MMMLPRQTSVDEQEEVLEQIRMRSSKRRRSVVFGQIELLEFPPAIGDNPSVSAGPPVMLARKASRRRVVDVDMYEAKRKKRRTPRQLVLSRQQRERMLLEQGFKQYEIAAAVRMCRKTKHNRTQSYHHKHWDGFTEKVEAGKRKLKKIVQLRRTPSSSQIAPVNVVESQDYIIPQSELLSKALILRQRVRVRDRRYRMKTYKKCFAGSEACDVMVAENMAGNRIQAVQLGRKMASELGLFKHASGSNQEFRDENNLFYCFVEDQAASTISGTSTAEELSSTAGASANIIGPDFGTASSSELSFHDSLDSEDEGSDSSISGTEIERRIVGSVTLLLGSNRSLCDDHSSVANSPPPSVLIPSKAFKEMTSPRAERAPTLPKRVYRRSSSEGAKDMQPPAVEKAPTMPQRKYRASTGHAEFAMAVSRVTEKAPVKPKRLEQAPVKPKRSAHSPVRGDTRAVVVAASPEVVRL